MSKRYYIAADGGGSKLHAILYNESFSVIRTAKVSGTNHLFKPMEEVKANLRAVLDELIGEEKIEIERADFCLVGGNEQMRELLQADGRVKKFAFHDEPVSSMAAALTGEGTLALAGTGSGVMHLKNGRMVAGIGGWGALLGDEGSGYDIGLRAIKAAVYAEDGRGAPTRLLELVKERWPLPTLYDLIFHLAETSDCRKEVASAALLASKAAREGDAVAIEIYEKAADEMFLMWNTLRKKHPEHYTGKTVITGGAWKGYQGMFRRFKQCVLAVDPMAEVIKPMYEPVVGCAVLPLLSEGMTAEEIQKKIAVGFAPLAYREG